MSKSNDTPSDDMAGTHPLRFTRPTSAVGCAFLWGVGFIILGVGLWQMGPVVAEGHNVWIPWGFGILLGILGLVTLWSCVYQLFLRRVPAAVVELSSRPLRIGKSESATVTQPGPVTLEFLRVRLLCIEQHTTWHKRNSRGPDGQLQSYSKTEETTLHQQTLVEATDLRVMSGDTWQQVVDFTIPVGTKPSRDGNARSIVWRLELSGKGSAMTKFLHPFEVQVRA